MSTDPRTDSGQFSEDLSLALTTATVRQRQSVRTLQEAVCNYIGHLRDQGVAAAEVPEAVRAFVHRVRHPQAPEFESAPRAEPLIEQMIAWCVDMHYWLV